MHIVDGVVSGPVLAAGTAVALAGLALGLRRLDAEAVPRTALLAAAFFVASLVHVPVGPSNAHLALTGLMGLVLGWSVFPAVLVGLLLQALFFGYGGITVLGLNTLTMALPAVACGYLCGPLIARRRGTAAALGAFAAGAGAVLLSALSLGALLAASGREFAVAAGLVVAAQLPVALVEGFVCAAAAGLLARVRPELIAPWRQLPEAA